MLSSGLPSTRTRSARLPASMVPESASRLHGAGGDDGGGSGWLHGRHAGLDVELEFAVEAVADEVGVAAGDDGDAGVDRGR